MLTHVLFHGRPHIPVLCRVCIVSMTMNETLMITYKSAINTEHDITF